MGDQHDVLQVKSGTDFEQVIYLAIEVPVSFTDVSGPVGLSGAYVIAALYIRPENVGSRTSTYSDHSQSHGRKPSAVGRGRRSAHCFESAPDSWCQTNVRVRKVSGTHCNSIPSSIGRRIAPSGRSVRAVGLNQKSIGSEVVGLFHVPNPRRGSQDDDRQATPLFVSTNPAEELAPGHQRHVPIEQNHGRDRVLGPIFIDPGDRQIIEQPADRVRRF